MLTGPVTMGQDGHSVAASGSQKLSEALNFAGELQPEPRPHPL